MTMAYSQCTKLFSEKIQLTFVMVDIHHKVMYTRGSFAVGTFVPIPISSHCCGFI